jgi:HD-GYP domain-containing protein (c-di-GMP phosphodiesterase class II)
VRIVFAADAFSAMTQVRPYRQAKSAESALDEVRRCAGSQFDPAVADVLIAAVRERMLESQPRSQNGVGVTR